MTILTFEIPGKITSANRVTRRVGDKSLKSASARRDHERIKGLAFCAAIGSRWKIPQVANVEVYAYNSRLDADNLCKVILDAMCGVTIKDDRPKHLGQLFIRHKKDKMGERYVVAVAPLPSQPSSEAQ